jgi:hypothetical protein
MITMHDHAYRSDRPQDGRHGEHNHGLQPLQHAFEYEAHLWLNHGALTDVLPACAVATSRARTARLVTQDTLVLVPTGAAALRIHGIKCSLCQHAHVHLQPVDWFSSQPDTIRLCAVRQELSLWFRVPTSCDSPPSCAGDGSVDHLDESVEQPGMLELKEGTYTLGRSAPADLVIGVPTVSAKHAELKVGEQSRCAVSSVPFMPDVGNV